MSMDVHGRGEQEGSLARHSNLRIYKLYVINCNFVVDYWDTAAVQDFVINVAAATVGYWWSL